MQFTYRFFLLVCAQGTRILTVSLKCNLRQKTKCEIFQQETIFHSSFKLDFLRHSLIRMESQLTELYSLNSEVVILYYSLYPKGLTKVNTFFLSMAVRSSWQVHLRTIRLYSLQLRKACLYKSCHIERSSYKPGATSHLYFITQLSACYREDTDKKPTSIRTAPVLERTFKSEN